MECNECKTQNPDEARYCKNCGKKLPKLKTCKHCGKSGLPTFAKFCPDCGKNLNPKEEKSLPIEKHSKKKKSSSNDLTSSGNDSTNFNKKLGLFESLYLEHGLIVVVWIAGFFSYTFLLCSVTVTPTGIFVYIAMLLLPIYPIIKWFKENK